MKSVFNEEINREKILKPIHAKIITVEGIDGSGKTTLVESCVSKFSNLGYKVKQFQTSSDRNMNQMFHNVAFLTYLKTLFIDELNNNDFVIGDWYIYGKMLLSELYTNDPNCTSKKLIANELTMSKIFLPDFSFYLDISPEEALKRIKKRKGIPEEKESLEMLRAASKLWKRYLSEYNIQILNGNFSTQELTDDIISRVLKVVKK